MDWKSISIGNKSVVSVFVGNKQIYPQDIFSADEQEFYADYDGDDIEVVITSVYGGVATGVSYQFTVNEAGAWSGGYTDGTGLGERIYSFHIPSNDRYEERHIQVKFTQSGTGKVLYVDIWQEEYFS